MRKARLAVVMAIAAVGLTGGISSSASADPPLNYGHCVSGGVVSPSETNLGPSNTNAAVDSAAVHASDRSGGHSRWSDGVACAPGA